MLQQLGTNTIRVYAVDPTADHSACMKALDDAGIYVIADLGVPGESINRDTPAWTTDLFARYQGVIDNLGQYQNTLGFFAGNEVTNNKTNSPASAFVKAAVRDSKAYIQSKNFGRWIGVGYATNDDADTRDNLASYFNCGADQSAAVDFWGYNIYEWCGQNTFQASGYQERTQAFSNYSVPAFFSEYGCNNPGGGESRVWQETGVLYSDLMNKVWSGGIVYEYFQEQNDFGKSLSALPYTTVPIQPRGYCTDKTFVVDNRPRLPVRQHRDAPQGLLDARHRHRRRRRQRLGHGHQHEHVHALERGARLPRRAGQRLARRRGAAADAQRDAVREHGQGLGLRAGGGARRRRHQDGVALRHRVRPRRHGVQGHHVQRDLGHLRRVRHVQHDAAAHQRPQHVLHQPEEGLYRVRLLGPGQGRHAQPVGEPGRLTLFLVWKRQLGEQQQLGELDRCHQQW